MKQRTHAPRRRLQVAGRCVLLDLGTSRLVFARHKFKPHAQLHDTQWSRSKIAQRGKKIWIFPAFTFQPDMKGALFCPQYIYDLTTNRQDNTNTAVPRTWA